MDVLTGLGVAEMGTGKNKIGLTPSGIIEQTISILIWYLSNPMNNPNPH